VIEAVVEVARNSCGTASPLLSVNSLPAFLPYSKSELNTKKPVLKGTFTHNNNNTH